ncbi:Mitochondrial assembly of ribosomal large subunit protein 1, partial [Eufriesea mexicana]
ISSLLQTRRLFYEYCKPCTNNVVTYFQLRKITEFSNNCQKHFTNDKNIENQSHNLFDSVTGTHKAFEDKDAEIIFDIHEKEEAINLEDLRINEEHYDPYEGINLERGINGVFEIEELVLLLQKDNAKDIFVASVPSEMSYVDYIVVVTGKSYKHMTTLAFFIRKIYKLKKHKTDMSLRIDGEKSKDWIALDLGNIVLHIFSHSARLFYDLETLWSVGPDYDDKCKSTTEDIMEQYNTFLSDLEPIENNSKN